MQLLILCAPVWFRAGAADVMGQVMAQLRREGRIDLRRVVGLLDLQDQRHQRFRDKTSAVDAEVPALVRAGTVGIELLHDAGRHLGGRCHCQTLGYLHKAATIAAGKRFLKKDARESGATQGSLAPGREIDHVQRWQRRLGLPPGRRLRAQNCYSLNGGGCVVTTRLSLFNSPLLLGFDQFERTLDRIAKNSAEGYPPYNIEQIGEDGLRITLAVAGFTMDDLAVQIEDNQLVIRGRQTDDKSRIYLHRGIAARQFQRSFVLAEGIEVVGATLDNGLLHVDLKRPIPEPKVRTIAIQQPSGGLDGSSPGGSSARTIDVTPDKPGS
jgi:HSP20 family molecular chaperone IbpA